jgi:hypothetical protein
MAAQGKIVGIVAWSLVGILAIGMVVVALMGGQQAGRAAGLGEALVQVAQTAGVAEWTPEVPAAEAGVEEVPEGAAPEAQALTASLLKDADVLAGVQARIQEAIRTVQAELAAAAADLATARSEASNSQSQVGSLSQQVQEQAVQADSLSKELAARGEALAAAQAELAKATEDAEAASQAADKQKTRLEKNIERLKAEKAEEVARLQAEIEALKTPPEPEWVEEAPVDEAAEPEIDLDAGRVVGISEMFSHIHYGENQTLRLQLLDGQTLIYEDVPPEAVDRLVAAADKLDVTFRFRVQGEYKSTPPDSVVIRKYWKWQRRHKARGEVRFVEPEAPVAEIAVPEEPAGEEPAAE